jgi:hypothetical protein
MELPAPLVSGTITYIVLTLLAMGAGVGMGVTGKMTRDNAMYGTGNAREQTESAERLTGWLCPDCLGCLPCSRSWAAFAYGSSGAFFSLSLSLSLSRLNAVILTIVSVVL